LPLPIVERSESEIAQTIRRKVEGIKGVKSCRQLSVRMSGKRFDVDMRVLLDANLDFERAHKISLGIEKKVKEAIPNARVSINTEPNGNSRENIWKLVKEIAEAEPGSRGVHNIHLQTISGKLCVDLHLEVSANMNVKQAHHVADQVEKKIKAADANISEVTVHIESASDLISKEMAGIETEMKSYIEHVAERFPEIKEVHGIQVRRFGDTIHIVLHCHFDPKLTIRKAHEVSNRLESAIKNAYPNVARIDVHEEPAQNSRSPH
jgi:divalent metal cation (Fe/Co/Zn/Cd) transporter